MRVLAAEFDFEEHSKVPKISPRILIEEFSLLFHLRKKQNFSKRKSAVKPTVVRKQILKKNL